MDGTIQRWPFRHRCFFPQFTPQFAFIDAFLLCRNEPSLLLSLRLNFSSYVSVQPLRGNGPLGKELIDKYCQPTDFYFSYTYM